MSFAQTVTVDVDRSGQDADRTYRLVLRALAVASAILVAALILVRVALRPRGLLLAAVVAGAWAAGLYWCAGRRFMRGRLRDLLFAGLVMVTLFLAAEMVFRAAGGFGINRASEFFRYRSRSGVPGARFVYVGEPGKRNEFRNVHRLNALGYNDTEHETAKPAGAYRIVVLGDSFVEALEVPAGRAFPRLLESDLQQARPGVEVVSMGRLGWGTLDEQGALRERGFGFQPDLVILAFFGFNDVQDNSAVLRERRARWLRGGVVPPSLKRRLGSWSDLGFLAMDAVDAVAVQMTVTPQRYAAFDARQTASDPEWAKAWDVTRDALRSVRSEVEARGARLLVASIPSREEVAAVQGPAALRQAAEDRGESLESLEALDFGTAERRLRDICAAEGIALLPLSESLRAEPYDQLYHRYDSHWNEQGHRAAARAIAGHVRDRYLQ